MDNYLLQVGYFRRSKTIKGKRTPTICKEVLLLLCFEQVFQNIHLQGAFGISQLIIYLLLVILQKDIVKEGQVLCYIEQLGGQIPVEVTIVIPFGFFTFFCFLSLLIVFFLSV